MLRDEPGAEGFLHWCFELVTVGRQRLVVLVLLVLLEVLVVQLALSHGCFTFLCLVGKHFAKIWLWSITIILLLCSCFSTVSPSPPPPSLLEGLQ